MNDNFDVHANSVNALSPVINHTIGDIEDEKAIQCITCLQSICHHLEAQILMLKEELECQKSNQN